MMLPGFLAIAFLTSFGIGVFLTAINVKYRDFRYVIPFVVQLGVYVSPVGFSSSIIPDKYRLIYSLNPMVGVLEGFRSAMLGSTSFPEQVVVVSLAMSIVLFTTGMFYFKRLERFFADII